VFVPLAAAVDLPILPVVIGALAALVPGGIFAALRYRREDDSAVVAQAGELSTTAVELVVELRKELTSTREDLADERKARLALAGEVRELRTDLGVAHDDNEKLREELSKTTDEVIRLRRTLVARGIDDA
jgi:hypothetical protein